MKSVDSDKLFKKAVELKIETIKMLDKANSGHVGGAFGMADIFTYLYYTLAKVDPENPEWDGRDYVLVSNGHTCPIWYTILADLGFFDKEELDNLRQVDSLLQGHPKISIPGVENSSGPLGHGLSQAVGIALGLMMDNKPNKVYCWLSDGEQQEGQTWEAAMSANKWRLGNLTAIMDRNGLQIEGTNKEIMPLGDLEAKYESFGWHVQTINAHDYSQIDEAFKKADENINRPSIIIAESILGKGVSFMENNWEFHDWKPKDENTADEAIVELKASLENK
jgi:transketolase